MAQYDKRKVLVTRHEYVLGSPAHGDEVGKAFAAAQHDMKAADVRTDIWLEAHDDTVVVVWTEKGNIEA